MPLESYTKYLPEPSPYITGSVPGQDSTAAAIGAGLGGLATIFDMGLKAHKEDRVSKRLNQFENEVSPFVQAVSQGRMKPQDALARTSAIMKGYIDTHPDMADDYRKRGQDIWGTNASAEVLKDAQALQAQERSNENTITMQRVKSATDAGVFIPGDGAGGMNIERMARAGDKIASAKFIVQQVGAELDNEYRAAQIGKVGETSPETPAARHIREWDKIQDPVNEVLGELTGAGWSITEKVVAGNKKLGRPEQEAVTGAMVRDLKSNAQRIVQQMLYSSKDPFVPETYDRAMKAIDQYYAPFENLLANKDFSNLAIWQRTAEMMTQRNKNDFQRSAPTLSRLADAFGGQGTAAIVGTIIATNPDITNNLPAEVSAFAQPRPAQPRPDLPSVLSLTESVVNGTGSILNQPNDNYRLPMAQALTGAVESLGRDPSKVTPEQLNAWGNTQADLAEFTLQKGSVSSVKSAVQRLNSPSQLTLFDKFVKQEPSRGTAIARQFLGLNQANINNIVPLISEPFTITEGTLGMAAKTGQLPTTKTGRVVYNASTGRVEFEGQAYPPIQMNDNIKRVNQSLENILHFQQYGPDNVKGMKPPQLKLELMKNSGIKIRGQTADDRKAESEGPAEVQIVDDDMLKEWEELAKRNPTKGETP